MNHKIQDFKYLHNFYVVNQYHTKSAISVFLLQCDIMLLQQFNKQSFNNYYKILLNNEIYE